MTSQSLVQKLPEPQRAERRRILALRLLTFALGLVLFYAPFALLIRLTVRFFHPAGLANVVPDVHRTCLLMPLNWFFQPSMYRNFLNNPLYLVVALLPAVAFLAAPLFCGWLCPAGGVTEFLSRLVPDRWKLDLSGRVEPAAIRYGFLAGYLTLPFLGLSVSCAYCNYSILQRGVQAAFGDLSGVLASWGSSTLISAALWFVVLGVFTRGGRGWCSFICPVGAVQGLAHAVGSRFSFTYKMKLDYAKCSSCEVCAAVCPTGAMTAGESGLQRNYHTCIGCQECRAVCSKGAISYGTGPAEAGAFSPISAGILVSPDGGSD